MTKIFLKILVLILVSEACNAQVVFKSVEEVWGYADTHNISIRTAQYEAEKASLSKMQAYGSMLPQVSISGSYTDNTDIPTNIIDGSIFGAPGTYRVLKLGQQFVYTGSFNAQMDILNLQNIFNAQVAKRTEEMNRASLANIKKTTCQQVATQFYSYLLMLEAARLAGESESTADSVYQSVNNKFKEGAVSEANVDVAKLNMERTKQTYITAQYQMLTAKNNLKALLGMSLKDSLDIQSVLQENLASEEGKTFQEDPAVKFAYAQVRMAQSQYRAANGAFAPTLSIVYNNTSTQYDSIYRPGTNAVPWFPATFWSLRANLPIFTGGTRYYQSRKNKINYLESKEQFENTQKQSAINDENVRLSYMRSQAVLEKAKNVMELGFDNYIHVSYKYE